MKFEDMQKAWQSHDASAKVMIDADVLLKEVRHNQRHFRAMIFWRDARQVGVAALLTGLFLHWAMRDRIWPLYIMAFTCFGVGAFMVVDRLIQRRKQPASNDSLKTCIESSLFQVNHQIWLLRNVFWWYLLPLGLGIAGFLAYLAWRVIFLEGASPSAIRLIVAVGAGCGLAYWGVYWLNHYAVRKNLEPRRQELETLLASLD
jgi:hypothetical protein